MYNFYCHLIFPVYDADNNPVGSMYVSKVKQEASPQQPDHTKQFQLGPNVIPLIIEPRDLDPDIQNLEEEIMSPVGSQHSQEQPSPLTSHEPTAEQNKRKFSQNLQFTTSLARHSMYVPYLVFACRHSLFSFNFRFEDS